MFHPHVIYFFPFDLKKPIFHRCDDFMKFFPITIHLLINLSHLLILNTLLCSALVGAAETLIETTEMFINRADFVELAADVMSRLVYVDWQRDLTTNRSRLLDSGICELCMKLLNKYVTSTPIACHCLMTIHNLGQCSTPNIQIKLCESGACESIVNALRENCRTCGSNDELDIGVAASGLMAIDALTDHFGNEHIVVRETISKFVDAGLCEVLISVLEKYAKNCEIQFDWTLQDDNAIESVLDCGQGVIRNLARRNELVRNRLKHLGAGNWLPELF